MWLLAFIRNTFRHMLLPAAAEKIAHCVSPQPIVVENLKMAATKISAVHGIGIGYSGHESGSEPEQESAPLMQYF